MAGDEPIVTKANKVELGGDGGSGWHSAYTRPDGQLVVEWLEDRDPAPYDHTTRIIFSTKQERRLRTLLGVEEPRISTPAALAEHFQDYWSVREYADAHSLQYEAEVDFQP